MLGARTLFSSKSSEYVTPKWLYKQLDDEFNFTLDPCTTSDNPLGAPKFFTKKDDGLKKSWAGERVYINPPYNRSIIKWVAKTHFQIKLDCPLVVMLLPARTDTNWFHSYIYNRHEIRFLHGRLKFDGLENSAPFPSMIVIFRPP